MESKVLISVISSQIDSKNKDDLIEIVTPGSFYIKGNTYYCVYDETEISGMEGTKTTFKIQEDRFLLIRNGNTTTKMDFEKDKKAISMYNTPYGTLELTIYTHKLDIDIDEKEIKIFIDYDMIISGQNKQRTSLNICIKKNDVM